MRLLHSLMRRFSIQLRMAGAIAMVVVLLLAVGGAGLGGMYGIHEQARQFREGAFAGATELVELTRAVGNARLAEKDLLLSQDDAARLSPLKRQWQGQLAEAQMTLQPLAAAPGELGAAAQRGIEQLQAYQAAFAKVVAALEAGGSDRAAIGQLSLPAAQQGAALQDTLNTLRKQALAAGVAAGERSQASARTSLVLTGAVLAAALLLVVPLTLMNSSSIVRPIRQARALAQAIAGGDLTQHIDVQGRDEAAELLHALQAMQQSLARLVGQVRESSESIQTASAEVASGNQDLSQRTEQAAGSLQQTASAMEQLTGTVRQSADAAAQANQLAASASQVASRGGAVVGQVVSTMDDINTSSKKIADIIGVIDGIAFQTNILALNAAVEAARAGEQGRGFAVVAGEVRSLAQRSAEAAREIKTLIGSSVDKVETGARLVQDAGSTMSEIVASVQRVSDIIGEITAATAEQSGGIGQINGSVNQLDQMTQQNAALVEQSAAAAESMKQQAHMLAEVVSAFRVEAAAPAAGATPL